MDRRRSGLLISATGVALLFASIWLFYHASTGLDNQSTVAAIPNHSSFKAPRQNIWAEISKAEAEEIYSFIDNELPHLNLVPTPKSAQENSIFQVETLRPNKTDALPYLFHDSKHIPERWAKVVLSENWDDGPYLVHYAVGPLPITRASQIVPLEFPFNNGRHWVQNPVENFAGMAVLGQSVGKELTDVTKKLLGAVVDPEDPDSLLCLPRISRANSEGLVLWFQFFRPGLSSGGRTLLPQGIYLKMNATGPDPEEWSVGQCYYNGILYDNIDEFRAAVNDPDFVSTPPNLDGPWTDTEDFDSTLPGRELPPPAVVQPYGTRYKLDREQKYVSWFGFEFFVTTAAATGLSLYDIRFKGERVMYELGLQEALAHYAGDDPMAGGQEFLDSFFGMGKNMFELIPGYDCPAYADFLDTEYHQGQEAHSLPNSICVFEYTADHLLSRHTAQYSITVSRNTYLVLRSASTVGNYDYTIDYIFYLDGSFEVKVRASGYIFAAFHTANASKVEGEYGHRIHPAVSSSMHDHVINFKADLDVAGPRNDLVRLALEPVTTSYPWDQPESPTRNTMHLVEHAVTAETHLDWPRNSAEFYIVYHSDKTNAWGEKRGYRITPGTGMGTPPHLTIFNSTTLGDSARWADHDIWVVRRKDAEPRSADPLNYLEPQQPLVNFQHIANAESLLHDDASDYDGDLVLYFNVGAHHVPHSGDVPNTLMHTSASSVLFTPHNFLDRDASRAAVQGVRLQLQGDRAGGFPGDLEPDPDADSAGAGELKDRSPAARDGPHAKYFGATYDHAVTLDLDLLEPDLPRALRSRAFDVSDLSFNGSAVGVWPA